jgi:lysophospholipase L1-like esterase
MTLRSNVSGLVLRAASTLAARMDGVRHVSVPLPPGAVDAFFCADRFHPSPYGYALWGAELGRAAAWPGVLPNLPCDPSS